MKYGMSLDEKTVCCLSEVQLSWGVWYFYLPNRTTLQGSGVRLVQAWGAVETRRLGAKVPGGGEPGRWGLGGLRTARRGQGGQTHNSGVSLPRG